MCTYAEEKHCQTHIKLLKLFLVCLFSIIYIIFVILFLNSFMLYYMIYDVSFLSL